MIIQGEDSECDTMDASEIEQALNRRFAGGHNNFWLGNKQKKFPSITILVSGDLAHISYFPGEDSPGFVSVGAMPCDNPYEMRRFFMCPIEEIWVAKYQLVPFSDAVKVAKEFATSEALPKCIRWVNLQGAEGS
jgi:hypothetical protein